MARKGTYVFDVRRLFVTGEQPFVVNSRKYVCLVDQWRDINIKEADGRVLTLEPMWSQAIGGGPVSLELAIVKDVKPDDGRERFIPHMFLRSVVLVGKSNEDDLGKIILSIPDKYKKVYEDIFKNDGDLEHFTERALAMLIDYEKYEKHCYLSEDERDQEEADTATGGKPKRKREEESENNDECNNEKKVIKTEYYID